ncbi:LysR family transcriptional regulator [Ruegeria atlantica]|uniref:LysR family transcriptional regulator n=1 Tax=Ruegeria atlantica TaxID=81569 RepID=UPI00147FD74D|nr:LysR family transcriptional regulator [Ruegeria atlantica]
MGEFARDLDWNLLYSFMIVAEEKSMTRAAEVLHKTQPAISQAIKRLEETTGVQLIERRKSGVIPTPAGARLLEQVKSIYTSISRLPVKLDQAPNAVSGKITIHTIDQVASNKVDDAITSFFDTYPAVDLEISIATTDEIISAVTLGACTIGISDGVVPGDLKSRVLLEESRGLYCGRNHRLSGRLELSESELRSDPFIGFTADVFGGKHMGDVTAFRARNSIGERVRGRSSFVNEVRRMIIAGLGIGFLPVHLAEPFVASGDLWQLPLNEKIPKATIFLITNPTIQLSKAEQLFIENLRL